MSFPALKPSYPETDVHPHHPGERAELYRAHDEASIELEFGQLLTALVVAWKPTRILETGTFVGVGAGYLAEGCRRNGFGEVTTLECSAGIVERARRNLVDWPQVRVEHADSLEWLRDYVGPRFDMMVLDSNLDTRIEELRLVRARHLLSGLAFVHDSSRLRAAGGRADCPDYPTALDSLGIPSIECPFSRGFRIFQL